jgi:hypothetical protein
LINLFFELTNSTNSPFLLRILILLIPFSGYKTLRNKSEMCRSTAPAEIFRCQSRFPEGTFYYSVNAPCFNSVVAGISHEQIIVIIKGNVEEKAGNNKLFVILSDDLFYFSAFVKNENTFTDVIRLPSSNGPHSFNILPPGLITRICVLVDAKTESP